MISVGDLRDLPCPFGLVDLDREFPHCAAQRAFSVVNDLSHLNKRACEAAELAYLLLPLPYEIQQQLKDVDEIEIERQHTQTASLELVSEPKFSVYCWS